MSIGLKRKCCRCCGLLFDLLYSGIDEKPENTSNVEPLPVRDWYAKIVPWVAPPAGVPHSVLLQIRRVLLQCLRRTACPSQELDPAQIPLPSTPHLRAEPDDVVLTRLSNTSIMDAREKPVEEGERLREVLGVQQSD